MTLFSWLWIAWGALFVAVEGAALVVKDAPAAPRTLTANVRWLISGAGPWHTSARVALAILLGWLPFHFGLPFTDWSSVWPNIVASVIWASPVAVAGWHRFEKAMRAHHARVLADVRAHTDAHHDRLLDSLKAHLGGGSDPAV